MSDIELAVKASKELEGILEQKFNAQGRGLHEKASSVQHLLPDAVFQQLRFIAKIRNQIVHEPEYTMDTQTRQRFMTSYEETKTLLDEYQISEFFANSTPIDSRSFTIPTHLKTFSSGDFKFVLKATTGEVASINERNFNGNVTLKIWMRLPNRMEDYYEFTNFSFLARQGHTITIFSDEQTLRLLAIYNHQIDQLFYLEGEIKKQIPLNTIDYICIIFGLFFYFYFAPFVIIAIFLNLFVLGGWKIKVFSLLPRPLQKKRIQALKQHIIKVISNSSLSNEKQLI